MEDLGHVALPVTEVLRIAQVTDVHRFPESCEVWENGRGQHVQLSDYACGEVELVEAVVRQAKPHFVVFTGDIIDGRPFRQMGNKDWASSLRGLIEPLVAAGIWWSFVPGNHDDDDAPWPREELLRAYELPLCASKKARSFNHTMTLGPPGEPMLRLWFFDSGGNHPDPKLRYETFAAEAVQGFRELSAQLPPLPSLAYFHIPLPEYGNLTPVHGTQKLFEAALAAGKVPRPWCWVPSLVQLLGFDRVVGSSNANSGLFDAFVESGQVRATFCGHDHASDAIFLRQGIFLCYGRVSGTSPPSDWEGQAPLPFQQGVRLVEHSSKKLVTWVETIEGEEPESRFQLA